MKTMKHCSETLSKACATMQSGTYLTQQSPIMYKRMLQTFAELEKCSKKMSMATKCQFHASLVHSLKPKGLTALLKKKF